MVVITHPKTLPAARAAYSRIAARARPFIDVAGAAAELRLDQKQAAKRLARWHEQGLLRRIRRGVYAVVPPSALLQEQVLLDPWSLVPQLFKSAYVGGWSAAEHWDLSEQVFTTLLVLTTDSLKRTTFRAGGTQLRARHIPQSQSFGTAVVWREGTRVLVSDVHKTVVDMFSDPALGGGIQHVAQCFQSYVRSENAEWQRLVAYAKRLGSAPAFKRMGLLCELLDGPAELTAACHVEVSLGLAKLDPALPSPRVSKRWQLRLPRQWEAMLRDG